MNKPTFDSYLVVVSMLSVALSSTKFSMQVSLVAEIDGVQSMGDLCAVFMHYIYKLTKMSSLHVCMAFVN